MSDTDNSELASWPIIAARAADDRQGADTIVIDVGEVLAITETFVITTGGNNRQVRAIAEAVEEQVFEAGGPKPLRIEGLDSFEWVLVDFGGFVVHVMNREAREYYELERLWKDQPRIVWMDPDSPAAAAAEKARQATQESGSTVSGSTVSASTVSGNVDSTNADSTSEEE